MKLSKKNISMVSLGLIMFIVSAVIENQISFAIAMEQKVSSLLDKAEEYGKNKGNVELVLKICHEAIKLEPQNLDTYYRCAFILGRMGDYLNAIKMFSSVIKSDEKKETLKYPAARKFRADCFMALGYMQSAVDDYSAILKRDSKSDKSGKIWMYMAEAFALMNRPDLALKAIANGCATGSHWCEKMKMLQKDLLSGGKIIPHVPLSN